MTGTYGPREKTFTLCAARTIIFQRKNLNSLIVLFHWVYFVFSIFLFSIANLFVVHYLWDKCCEHYLWQSAADICFAWLVYLACLHLHVLRAYCTFELKQANLITPFGRHPNKKLHRCLVHRRPNIRSHSILLSYRNKLLIKRFRKRTSQVKWF